MIYFIMCTIGLIFLINYVHYFLKYDRHLFFDLFPDCQITMKFSKYCTKVEYYTPVKTNEANNEKAATEKC